MGATTGQDSADTPIITLQPATAARESRARHGSARVIPTALLLDTNVWLDNFLGARPVADASRRLIDVAVKRGMTLLCALTSIKDAYYMLWQEFKRDLRASATRALTADAAAAAEEAAWACVQSLREIATVVGADESDLWLAERHHRVHRDLEDNLVVAAAQRSHADYLVTNDARLLAKATVPAVSPADMLALLGEA